jgi:hypothetical protein
VTILLIACYSIAFVGFCIAGYWMRGASLWLRSTAAIRRGDFEESNRLARQARRWSVGVRDNH